MRNLRHALREAARVGKASVRVTRRPSHHVERRCLGSLSLESTADRRATAGVDARRPTRTMELRRAEEVQKCADKGWKSALICLGNMRKGGVAPGSAAYNVALKACTEAGEWDRAAALLADMEGTGGATPDTDIVVKIEKALAAAGEGEEGEGTTRGEEGVLGDLSCDSAPTQSSSSADPESGSSGKVNAGKIVRSKAGGLSSSGGGVSGGGTRGSIAGMHTMVALGADASWPSRRSSGGDDGHNNNGNSNKTPSGRSMSNTSINNSSGSRGSMADLHAIMALGADSPWPSRRTSHANDGNGNGNDSGMDDGSGGWAARRRSPSSLSWGDWRWPNGQHRIPENQNQREEEKGGASPADAFRLGRGYRRAGIRAEKIATSPSSQAAPFAGTWGDD